MPMTSYAQNREDVLLSRLFPRGLTGFYVDVGANDPVQNSVTRWFYDQGWRGINIEPAAHPFQRLAEARERDVNLNIGVSDHDDTMTFYEFPPEVDAVSTFSATQAAWHEEQGFPPVARTVEVTTLAKVFQQHVEGTIDFLSVDVEGHERQVLEGNDWEQWRPRVVMVEATQPTTTIPTHDQWEEVLIKAGYIFGAFDGLNRYYVREEDSDLLPALATPVNVADSFIPYEYLKPIQDLRLALDTTSRQLAATRALNQSLWSEYAGLPKEYAVLRAELERLTRGLANTRSQYQALRATMIEEQAPCAELLDEVGPLGLGIARRLSRLSRRHSGAADSVKRLVSLVRRGATSEGTPR